MLLATPDWLTDPGMAVFPEFLTAHGFQIRDVSGDQPTAGIIAELGGRDRNGTLRVIEMQRRLEEERDDEKPGVAESQP